jgi:hypothetical protein
MRDDAAAVQARRVAGRIEQDRAVGRIGASSRPAA